MPTALALNVAYAPDLLDERQSVVGIDVLVQSDDGGLLGIELPGEGLQEGHLPPAGSAPTGPEVHDHDLPAVCLEARLARVTQPGEVELREGGPLGLAGPGEGVLAAGGVNATTSVGEDGIVLGDGSGPDESPVPVEGQDVVGWAARGRGGQDVNQPVGPGDQSELQY